MATRMAEIERATGMGRGSFKQFLASIGVAPEIAMQQIEASVAWGKIIRRRVRSQVEVTDSEIDDTLNRLRGNIGKTETRVAEIFMPVDRAEQADEAHKAAERVEEQIKRGAPFAALAQQFSQGQTAQSGGDLGWVLPGTLDPGIEAAIEKMPPHQATPPDPHGGGLDYHVCCRSASVRDGATRRCTAQPRAVDPGAADQRLA